ncbi:MAG: hypothetical protein WC809_07320 [Sinimarinibacterium sp.]|jgi:hypothetical protein
MVVLDVECLASPGMLDMLAAICGADLSDEVQDALDRLEARDLQADHAALEAAVLVSTHPVLAVLRERLKLLRSCDGLEPDADVP